jgi:hypothetical protein
MPWHYFGIRRVGKERIFSATSFNIFEKSSVETAVCYVVANYDGRVGIGR